MSPGKKPTAKKPRPAPTPKRRQLWDIPPHPIAGDSSDEITFAAVGRAISAWEAFEHSMSHLFAVFIGVTVNTLPASRAYGSVLTFRGRADMIEAAAEARFFENSNADLQAEVSTLLKECRGFSGRRNEIAHGVVRQIRVPAQIGFNAPKQLMPNMKIWGFAVVPSDYATNKTELTAGFGLLQRADRKPRYTYTSVEINEFATKFQALAERTRVLSTKIFDFILHVEQNA